MSLLFDNVTELLICSKYKEGFSTIKLAKEFNCSHTSINVLLKKNEVVVKRYPMDDSYFKTIDTKDKSYFLGLLYADGCLSSNSNAVSIGLLEQDKLILETFKTYLKTSIPLSYVHSKKMKNRDYMSNPMYILQYSNKQIHQDLCNLGCVPRKSLILKFPTEEQVPEKYLPDFIRGYFDGDGCISFNTETNDNRNYSIHIKFVGTLELITSLKSYLISRGLSSISISKDKKHLNNTYSLSIRNMFDTLSFIDLIYDDKQDIFLQRKYLNFYRILDYCNRNSEKFEKIKCLRYVKNTTTKQEIISLYKQGKSYKVLSKIYNVSLTTIRNIVKSE